MFLSYRRFLKLILVKMLSYLPFSLYVEIRIFVSSIVYDNGLLLVILPINLHLFCQST
jgi:hypothetical protein